jgi:hypothetical protein
VFENAGCTTRSYYDKPMMIIEFGTDILQICKHYFSINIEIGGEYQVEFLSYYLCCSGSGGSPLVYMYLEYSADLETR